MRTNSKKKLLSNSRLYLILNKGSCRQNDVVGILRRIGKKGVDLVQLREKRSCSLDFLQDAQEVKRLCRKLGIVFLVNNRLDIALIVDADGLHLGQSDIPLKAARRLLGKNKIIGISCHNLAQAQKAESQGADYIGIGPIFPTKTKPGSKPIGVKALKEIKRKIEIPFFAIGGINLDNIQKVKTCGVNRVAICKAICCSRNIKNSASNFQEILHNDSD